ncbi:MAG: phage tail sheath family protein [Schwartzia sp.]|nr:phage tail sheath family protein [Schwartzia sp. (in: firmicutes)]
MAYRHGIYGSEVPTSLVPMTQTDSGLVVAFGTAPVHVASDPAAANTPVLCYTYKEAVAAFGYDDDFSKYTLCEVMKSHYALFNMAPVVFVNVLDITRHKKAVSKKEIQLEGGAASVSAAAILSTLKVFATAEAATALTKDIDYTAAFDDENNLIITALSGGAITAADARLYLDFDEVDAAAVTAADIVGGVDSATGKSKGLELVDDVFPRFGLVPGIIIAPKFSSDSVVAAVMKAKTTNIDGHFRAIAVADIPADTVDTYTKASEWKNRNNFIDTSLVACWPMVSLGGQKYHLSTQLAGIMNKTDAAHDDIPYYSPSNKGLQADSSVLADGQEVFLSSAQAAYLNGQGIVTALNFIGGWKSWGNRTTVYPSNTDVKDNFIPIRRMFNWVLNTLITSFWSKVDDPMNKRLVETIMDSANIWLNGLTAKGALLGGRVEFRSDENTTTDLMDGKIKFHVYMTPPSPAREIEFVQEYDPEYIQALFA